MECKRVTEFVHAAWLVQKCSCTDCANRKNDTEAFWKRFDALYKEYMGQVQKV